MPPDRLLIPCAKTSLRCAWIAISCIAGALHVRAVAKLYGVPVILHTDHAQKSWLPWIDGLMEANEEYFKQHGEPLFSSHMLDLSEEPLEENIAICKKYLERMAKVNVALEFGGQGRGKWKERDGGRGGGQGVTG